MAGPFASPSPPSRCYRQGQCSGDTHLPSVICFSALRGAGGGSLQRAFRNRRQIVKVEAPPLHSPKESAVRCLILESEEPYAEENHQLQSILGILLLLPRASSQCPLRRHFCRDHLAMQRLRLLIRRPQRCGVVSTIQKFPVKSHWPLP